jgi:hypothetical protein
MTDWTGATRLAGAAILAMAISSCSPSDLDQLLSPPPNAPPPSKPTPVEPVPNRVQIIDGDSQHPLAKMKLRIEEDTGVRCAQAPCPAWNVIFEGTTDDEGFFPQPKSKPGMALLFKIEGHRITPRGGPLPKTLIAKKIRPKKQPRLSR